MKALFVLVVVAVMTSEACEEHRRIAAMRRAELAAQARLRNLASQRLTRAREDAVNQVRTSIYRSQPRMYEDPSAPSGSNSHWQYANELPPRSKFCPGSDVYYCSIESECRMDTDTGSWRCFTERRVIPHYTSYHTPTNTRRFYHRPPTTFRKPSRSCRSGFQLSADNSTCIDIDECADGTKCTGAAQKCKNIYGGYSCPCLPGYARESSSSQDCIDRDECKLTGICGIGECKNTAGSYECNCPGGYTKVGKRSCKDINECEENPCSEDDICFNIWGGYKCDPPIECEEGYRKQNTSGTTSEVCILENPGLSRNRPNVISYRRVLVPTKERADLIHAIATVNLRSPNTEFNHYFAVKITEGQSKFRYRKRYETNYGVQISLYNRVPLENGEELPLVLQITDHPTRRGSYISYSYNSRTGTSSRPAPILPTIRVVNMTVIPAIHGM